MEIRLNKIIAQSGICSRRKADELISAGKVKINDSIVTDLGTKTDPRKDKITVNDLPLKKEQKTYIMLNKPAGYITTRNDPHAEKTVFDLLPGKSDIRLFPVGRLDKDTTGLLILTNDGQLSYQLTHPKFNIDRIYEVRVQKSLADNTIIKIEKGGLEIDDYKTSPCRIKIIKKTRASTSFLLTIGEGKKREIRKMFALLNHPVKELKRIQYGKLKLGHLPSGKWKEIRKNDII